MKEIGRTEENKSTQSYPQKKKKEWAISGSMNDIQSS